MQIRSLHVVLNCGLGLLQEMLLQIERKKSWIPHWADPTIIKSLIFLKKVLIFPPSLSFSQKYMKYKFIEICTISLINIILGHQMFPLKTIKLLWQEHLFLYMSLLATHKIWCVCVLHLSQFVIGIYFEWNVEQSSLFNKLLYPNVLCNVELILAVSFNLNNHWEVTSESYVSITYYIYCTSISLNLLWLLVS